MLPFFQGGEVEKAEIHRLLELVDKVSGQQHVGDMGLHQFDLRGRVRIGGGLQQVVDKGGQL